MSLTRLGNPVVRRVGKLIVRIHAHGIDLRGYRRRRWTSYTWSQVAGLADGERPILKSEEIATGRRALEQICNGKNRGKR